jgi:hypothetical protein
MAKPTFDEFAAMLDRAVDRIPLKFTQDLNGGFNAREDTKRDGKYYVLGEYTQGGHLGSFIVFYYGSFVVILKDKPYDSWEAEIMDTVLHEMQHHLEAQAGRDDLARSEIEELAQALRRESNNG